jgi:hypothetical protein
MIAETKFADDGTVRKVAEAVKDGAISLFNNGPEAASVCPELRSIFIFIAYGESRQSGHSIRNVYRSITW